MIYRPDPNCVACAYGDGIAVLSMATNTYFSLDDVGARIWKTLEPGADLDQILAAVTEEFDVSPDVCRPDIELFLNHLSQSNLIESQP